MTPQPFTFTPQLNVLIDDDYAEILTTTIQVVQRGEAGSGDHRYEFTAVPSGGNFRTRLSVVFGLGVTDVNGQTRRLSAKLNLEKTRGYKHAFDTTDPMQVTASYATAYPFGLLKVVATVHVSALTHAFSA